MNKAKILIVEDNPIVAEDIKMKLSRMGYEVTGIASSATEAFDSVRHVKKRYLNSTRITCTFLAFLAKHLSLKQANLFTQ